VIARSPYGLLMQILAGLITYLLLAIYCHEQYGEHAVLAEYENYVVKSAMKLLEIPFLRV